MHIDQARNEAFRVLLCHRQNRVLLAHGDDEPEELQRLLIEAEETITYALVDMSLEQAAKRAGVGKHILATYGSEWAAIDNGREYIDRVLENIEVNSELAAIAAKIDRQEVT